MAVGIAQFAIKAKCNMLQLIGVCYIMDVHRAGLTIVPVVPWEGALAAMPHPPLSTAKFLPCCVDV